MPAWEPKVNRGTSVLFGVWGPNDLGPDKKAKNELYDFDLFPQFMHIDWVRVYQTK